MKTKIFLFVYFLLIPINLWAATYYVSNTGSGSTCSIGSPCSISYAFTNAVAGDTWLFRGGTYNIPAHTSSDTYIGTYTWANSGTGDADNQRIIFKAYTGETPILNGTLIGGGEAPHCFHTMISTYNTSYITIDGFTFQSDSGTTMPRFFIGAQTPISTGIKFLNNIMNGGAACSNHDNEEGLRIQKSDQALVKGNIFYNFSSPLNDYYGVSAIKSYTSTNITIENNEFYNSSTAIYLKSNIDGSTTRYNFIHDCYWGILGYTDGYHNRNGNIYHNIISTAGQTHIEVWDQIEDINNWHIYNNTIYNTSAVTSNPFSFHADNSGTGWQIYNNIIEAEGSDYSGSSVRIGGNSGIVATIFDYNGYGAHMRVSCAGTGYTSVATLNSATCAGLTAGNHNTHSVAGATVFTNAGGSMALISDFALHSSSPGYHAGNDGKDMGADVSLVGTTGEGDTTPPTLSSATIAPNGTTLTLAFSESVTQGAGYNNSHWDVDCSSGGNNIAVTYASGNGTASHVYSIGKIYSGDTCNIDFSGTADSEEDGSGNDLAAIVSTSVTNNSTQTVGTTPSPVTGIKITGGVYR